MAVYFEFVKAIVYRKSNGHSANDLRNDIMNYIYHVFGHHTNCADSNVVESYNAIIAKVIGGKRINYAMGKS